MKAKEIREQFGSAALGKVQNEDFPYSHGLILGEIAAQLAEQNEKLNILLNPPMMYDTAKIDPTAFEDLGNFIRPSITFMEPRATLRDQFAMAALQGHIGCDPTCGAFWQTGPQMQDAAKNAYAWANVMMEVRK
jgi:hypothetical protein